jgi:D-sedoheptulose 7-phosphate isomerase
MSPEPREAIARVDAALRESASVKEALRKQAPAIHAAAMRIAGCFREGGRLYACGNGGSACDAMHLVEELVARYRRDRPGLPAHHLLDAPTLTCWSNDYEYETAFRRQVETMVRTGDVLVAISTSGNSPNVVLAAEAAIRKGAWVLALTGGSGGRLVETASAVLAVPSTATERIQEAHITVIHIICDLLEETLFGTSDSETDPTPS